MLCTEKSNCDAPTRTLSLASSHDLVETVVFVVFTRTIGICSVGKGRRSRKLSLVCLGCDNYFVHVTSPWTCMQVQLQLQTA